MATKSEFKQWLTDLKVQVQKAKQEVTDKIKSLEDAINNSDNVPEDIVEAFKELKTAVQEVDDINPDAPTPGPAPVPEPEGAE